MAEDTVRLQFDTWPSRWANALHACAGVGGKAKRLRVSKPATGRAITKVEKKLGFELPDAFRLVLIQFSSRVEMSWYLPAGMRPLAPLQDLSSGNCEWDLSDLPGMDRYRRETVEGLIPFFEETYVDAWQNALVFQMVKNGDCLALDLTRPGCPVTYLSHEGSEFNGHILGKNFIDFMDRWSLLGCPGAECWQLMPFVGGDGLLDPHGENAQRWQEWFHLQA